MQLDAPQENTQVVVLDHAQLALLATIVLISLNSRLLALQVSIALPDQSNQPCAPSESLDQLHY